MRILARESTIVRAGELMRRNHVALSAGNIKGSNEECRVKMSVPRVMGPDDKETGENTCASR